LTPAANLLPVSVIDTGISAMFMRILFAKRIEEANDNVVVIFPISRDGWLAYMYAD
jgi:hypothetical protein